jgi:hypothetical protein
MPQHLQLGTMNTTMKTSAAVLAIVVATAGCGGKSVAVPGLPGLSHDGLPANPVPGVTGPGVQVVVGGVEQQTAFCNQAHSRGDPCHGPPATQVFCGDWYKNAHPEGEPLAPPPVFVIAWGAPPPSYKGPNDPGEHNTELGRTDPEDNETLLSGVEFFKTDLTTVFALDIDATDVNYIYAAANEPGTWQLLDHDHEGHTVHATQTGKTWHITGTISGEYGVKKRDADGHGTVDGSTKPFDVTVTCQ